MDGAGAGGAWIRGAGGVAVVAHPGRYRISGDQLLRLLGDFRDAGGQAIEVVSGSHGEAEVRQFARLARDFGFYASRARPTSMRRTKVRSTSDEARICRSVSNRCGMRLSSVRVSPAGLTPLFHTL